MRGEEILATVGAPAHGTAELARRVADQRVLGRKARFHAEAAADVADDDTEILRLRLEHGAEQIARAARCLVLRVERSAAILEHRRAGARFERHRYDTLVVQLDLGDMRGRGERFGDLRRIAVLGLCSDVARRLRPYLRRARRDRLFRIDHRW